VTISIIMPCYNAAAFIEGALASLQAQTHKDWECLVVDDCSSDYSLQVVETIAKTDPRFRLLRLSVNQGPGGARNVGLSAARGDWITLLDADDLYQPDRLRYLLSVAQRFSADLVFDNLHIFDADPQKADELAFALSPGEIVAYSAERYFEDSAKFGRLLDPGYMKPMIRRSVIEATGLRYDSQFRTGEDFLFCALLFADGVKAYGTGWSGYLYRRHQASISFSGGANMRGQAQVCEEIIQIKGKQLSERSRRAIRRRQRHFARAADLNVVATAVRQRRYSAAAEAIVRRPRTLLTWAATLKGRLLRGLRLQ
jgi:glycosyltransferase involved in cell wall biosynthesis